MVKEAILKAITHTSLIVFMGLVALLPLQGLLRLQQQMKGQSSLNLESKELQTAKHHQEV